MKNHFLHKRNLFFRNLAKFQGNSLYLIILWLIIFLPFETFSQASHDIDELEIKLSQSKEEARLPFLIELAEITWKENPEQAVIYIEEAREYLPKANPETLFRVWSTAVKVYESLKNDQKLAEALIKFGQEQERQRELVSAIETYKRGLEMAKELGDQQLQLPALAGIGGCYSALNQFSTGLPYLEQAIHLCEKLGDHEGQGKMLINIGNGLARREKYENAIPYFQQAEALFEENNLPVLLGIALQGRAGIYMKTNENSKAIELYERSISSLSGDDPQNLFYKGNALNNLASLYLFLEQPEKASPYFEEAIIIQRKMGDSYGLTSSYTSFCDYARLVGDLNLALQYADSAEKFANIVQDLFLFRKNQER